MPAILPDEFDLGHDLSFILHDHLAEHLVQGEQAELQFFEVTLKSAEDAAALEGLQGVVLWDWFEQNGYRDVLDAHSYRNLIFALLSDMCQFIYEALRCSEKGKLSVAFSNLRKPLQDNLFLLEWILADWPAFLAAFRGGPEQIDLSKNGRDAKKAIRTEVIGKAMDKTETGRWIEPDLLYELRYEKASGVGLDPIFNQAIHLVTTVRDYATSPENINFVFCSHDDRERLWRQLYRLLPVVLMHALFVVRALFKTLADDFEPRDFINDLWLATGFLLWAEATGQQDTYGMAVEFLNETLAEASLHCPECRTELRLPEGSIRAFWDSGEVRCGNCAAVFVLLEPQHVVTRPPAGSDGAPSESAGA